MGIDEATLADINRWQDSDRFSPLERLALQLADAMCATPAEVSDDLRAALLEHLTPGQLAELASSIAWENHRGRLNRALDVKAMGFTDGGYCVLPHRAEPQV
jgi:alkylhydroperoxidase family enzyme